MNTDTADGIWLDIISGTGDSGARGFRWDETYANPVWYAEATIELPIRPTVTGWLQVMQIKSKAVTTDPFWFVQLRPGADGSLEPVLVWWNQLAGKGVEGPHIGERLAGFMASSGATVPIGESFRLGMAVKESAGFDGRVIVILNGQPIIDQAAVKTGYPDSTKPSGCSQQWSVNLYGNSFSPSLLRMLVSEASIWAVSGL